MAPAERKKVLLKQKSCSLEENKTESQESEQTSRKGKGRSPLMMASREYDEAVKNNIISSSSSSRNSSNIMERACSEDRGLRRRPKVFSSFFIVIFILFINVFFKRFSLLFFIVIFILQKESPAWLSWSREQLGETPRFLIGTGSHRSRFVYLVLIYMYIPLMRQ